MTGTVYREAWIRRILDAWETRSIVWLYGVRRAGKTTLARSLGDVEYFDCDLASVRRQLSDPEGILPSLRGKRVVFDEIHRLDRPSELLKNAADHFPDVRIVATGSSTLAATSKFSDSLTGRKHVVWLTPMSHADLAVFGGDLGERLWRGGLPPFYLGTSIDADVSEWMQSYWARDVQELFRIERRSSFVRFVELLLADSGGLFEATRYAAQCEVSRQSIVNYLDVLDVTRIASIVRPFSTRRSNEIVRAPKVYGFDTGIVRHNRGWAEPRPEDLGTLWEHYVLNEIHATAPDISLRFWRTKSGKEVDFVVPLVAGAHAAIECKWRAYNARGFRGLSAFRRLYSDGPNFVVGQDVTRRHKTIVDGIRIEYLPIDELGEALRAARHVS